jgi:hypothetical protein
MKAKIRNIVDHGQSNERIVLDIIADTDIGEFLILDTTYTSSGSISNKVRHPYWFPDKKVEKGDLVVVYTKKGTNSSKTNTNGTTSHFFYWGLDSNVWNNDGDCALLLHIHDWESHRVTISNK